MEIEWKKYPDNKPEEAGYYMCYYLNPEDNKYYFKALSYSPSRDEWIFRFKPEVIAYIPESRNNFYVPCEQWANERVIKKPSFVDEEEDKNE